jgi:hypothetical protein
MTQVLKELQHTLSFVGMAFIVIQCFAYLAVGYFIYQKP